MNPRKMCVVLAAWCALHCDREEELLVRNVTTTESGTPALCLYGEYQLSGEELLLLARKPADPPGTVDGESPCEDQVKKFTFTITKDEPKIVVVRGLASVEYCLQVVRESGYLVISHEHGTVNRNGDLMTWCITTSPKEDPERMTVRSLTAQGSFMLSVP